jgi:hypothetical protein
LIHPTIELRNDLMVSKVWKTPSLAKLNGFGLLVEAIGLLA